MILRDLNSAVHGSYDVIIIGGGIYGACTLLEAARRGLRGLLLERDDFGGATSWNSLRILHGGLRYLQTFDLRRFRQSVRERRWFCRHFPEHVAPLPCLMPLYGEGFKKPSVFRVALGLNECLSWDRNFGVASLARLPAGKVVSAEEVVRQFPTVEKQELCGGGQWYDIFMQRPYRVLIDILKWATSLGSTALNYTEAVDILADGQRVAGVVARDRVEDQRVEFRANTVVNCAGPWSQSLAEQFETTQLKGKLFQPSLAWNVLLSKPSPSRAALAVSAHKNAGHTFFVLPWRGRTFAGTVHSPWQDPSSPPAPSEAEVEKFLSALNTAIPQFGAVREDVVRIYAGLLPVTKAGTTQLARRPYLVEHSSHGGLQGLVSVCGVKYTTSRQVAQQILGIANRAWGSLKYRENTARPQNQRIELIPSVAEILRGKTQSLTQCIESLVREESVVCTDDLILRRTDWGEDPSRIPEVAEIVQPMIKQSAPSVVAELAQKP